MPLRILTANLYNGRAEPGSFAAVLDETNPDVVAVQELSASSAEVLEGWGRARLLDPRDDTTGIGLASKVSAELDRIDFPHRNPVRAYFDGSGWGFGDVEVVNAHVVNPISRPFSWSRSMRKRELAALQDLLTEPVATRVLVGDFNSSPAWPLYRRLAALAEDGPVAAGTARRTWSYFPNTPRALRIDHAFVHGARCTSSHLVKIAGSDHRGLVVDVEPTR